MSHLSASTAATHPPPPPPSAAVRGARSNDASAYADTLRWVASRATWMAHVGRSDASPRFVQACVLRFHRSAPLLRSSDDISAWVDALIRFELRTRRAERASNHQQGVS